MLDVICGLTTEMSIVALLERPKVLVTLTTNRFVPASVFAGVPESAPVLRTVNHAGPLSFPNARTSFRFGLTPFVAIEPEYDWPADADGASNGFRMNPGMPPTTINKLAVFESPATSVTLTWNELLPASEL